LNVRSWAERASFFSEDEAIKQSAAQEESTPGLPGLMFRDKRL